MKATAADEPPGIVHQKHGRRFQLRLWPDPIFREEHGPDQWHDVERVEDDFNHTALKQLRATLEKRYRSLYPELVDAIMSGRPSANEAGLPVDLWGLNLVQRRILHRERMLSVIPAPILDRVRQYPEGHFHLLQCFAACPEALRLAEDAPALAFLCALHPRFPGVSAPLAGRALRAMLGQKRRAILQWLGLTHGGNSILRILCKVTPTACRLDLLASLRTLPDRPKHFRRVLHLPEINLGALTLAADPALMSRVSNRLLRDVAADPSEHGFAEAAQQLRVCLRSSAPDAPPLPDLLHSRRHLALLFADSLSAMGYEEVAELNIHFPEPPVPGIAELQPLRTPGEVMEEGCEQGNCVITLLPELASGKLALYRVLRPERATLTLFRRGGAWRIDQLEAACNKSVSAETWNQVRSWLAGAHR